MAMQKISSESNPAWNGKDANLKEGDKLRGFYVGKKTNVGKYNSTVYTVLTEGDKKQDVWGSTVIDPAFDQIKMGAEIEIEFVGTKDTGKGNPAKIFEISADNEHPNTKTFEQ